MTIDGELADPCVEEFCNQNKPGDGCGTFSAFAMWLPNERNGSGMVSAKAPEIGILWFATDLGRTPPYLYTYCGLCDGVPEEGNVRLHGYAAPGMNLSIWYNKNKQRWEWIKYVGDQKTILRAHSDIGVSGAARADIGGETLKWTYEMGVQTASNPSIYLVAPNRTQGTWVEFIPNPAGTWQEFYHPGEDGHGRYRASSDLSPSFGGRNIGVTSDHHALGTNSACEEE